MHLAAINNQPEVMEFFLSHNKASILRNGDNQTILDIAVSLEMKEVAVVIAKHDRYYNPLFDDPPLPAWFSNSHTCGSILCSMQVHFNICLVGKKEGPV